MGSFICGSVVADEGQQAVSAEAGETRLAIYKDIVLTETDLLQELRAIQQKTGTRDVPNRDVIFTLVDHLMLRKIMANEAMEKELINELDMDYRLQRQREVWLAQARKNDLVMELAEKELDQVAYEMFLAKKDQFVTPEQVKVSHILIATKERSDEEAKMLAEELHSKIVKDPAVFEALAKEFSEDKGSREKGGSLDWAERKRFVKPFSEAAFTLKEVGQLSGLVKTKFGYHIIRLDGYQEETPLNYEQVKPNLVKQAIAEINKTSIDYYMAETKSSKDYVYDEAAVDKFFYQNYGEGREKKPLADEMPSKQPGN